MSHSWAHDAVFYHVYPLGLCGAPEANDFHSPAVPRLEQLYDWMGHWREMGVNALYLGPLFESTRHGYDTVDYFWVDRRLGNNEVLKNLVRSLHDQGIRVILDGVFNHVGRDFWAFKDVLSRGPESPYCSWFANLRFGQHSPYGDPFTYESWHGAFDLVKLNLSNPDVRNHLFDAVRFWIREFEIDGLRLDAADSIDLDFLRELSRVCREQRPDFYLMGEVVFGDYRRFANPETLDATTNYECYKGLYSSHNDKNYFEIAYSFDRQFGKGGIYQGLPMYAFLDNHDVDRINSVLKNPAHLYPSHIMLFTMPGVPSVYYGSEWGMRGRKQEGGDPALRPALKCSANQMPQPELAQTIGRLAQIRHRMPALKHGDYRTLSVASEQISYMRQAGDAWAVVAVNSAASPVKMEIPINGYDGTTLVDVLNPGDRFTVNAGKLCLDSVHACWGRILVPEWQVG